MAQVSFVLLARYLFTAILAADKLVFHWRGRDQSYLKCCRHTGNPVLPRSGTRGNRSGKVVLSWALKVHRERMLLTQQSG